jgi:hypothetical protein
MTQARLAPLPATNHRRVFCPPPGLWLGYLRAALVAAVVLTLAIAVTAAVLPAATVAEAIVQEGVCTSLTLAPLTVQVSVMVPLNPPAGIAVTVDEVDPPGETVAGLAFEAVRLNDGATTTVIVDEVDPT